MSRIAVVTVRRGGAARGWHRRRLRRGRRGDDGGETTDDVGRETCASPTEQWSEYTDVRDAFAGGERDRAEAARHVRRTAEPRRLLADLRRERLRRARGRHRGRSATTLEGFGSSVAGACAVALGGLRQLRDGRTRRPPTRSRSAADSGDLARVPERRRRPRGRRRRRKDEATAFDEELRSLSSAPQPGACPTTTASRRPGSSASSGRGRARSTGSTSTSSRARSTASSARTAPASRRRC